MNTTRDENVAEIDLLALFFSLLHHIKAIAITTVAGALIGGLISVYLITPQYQSTAKIYILTKQDAMVSLGDLQLGSNLAKDYLELIKSRPVVEQVAENLKLNLPYKELLSHLQVSNVADTRIINITVTYPDPVVAMEIANEFASVSRTQISAIMRTDEPTEVESAIVAKGKSSPSNSKNVVLGGLVGVVLAAGIFTVIFLLDDSVKSAEDVERYLGLNTLAVVPDEGDPEQKDKKKNKKKAKGRRK